MIEAARGANIFSLRPGLISGGYPERGDSEPGWLDRACTALRGRLGGMSVKRTADLRKVVVQIDHLGTSLAGMEESRIDELLLELRRRFGSQGLSARLCLRAFALIREIAGRSLGQRHYAEQLMGGWVLLRGELAEMATGEGKTLAATLAAATAALAGIPVHVLTVNEYLVRRDAAAMDQLYRALGLSVGFVTQEMPPEQRRAGYACDITYCTNKQVAFDYLRDRLLRVNERGDLRRRLHAQDHASQKGLLLRGLCFALVDEADSVLIDEARTPLILTRAVDSSQEHTVYRQALSRARELQQDQDFQVDHAGHRILLTRAGQQRLQELHVEAAGVWRNARRREELIGSGLHALHLLQRDRDYLVKENKVQIIDANTGRNMPDRSWERGLHQLVEAKEGCPLTEAREQVGRLTYQSFFRRYLHLGGMTGTASEVGNELWSIYGLRVRRIPLHRPCLRLGLPDRVFARAEEKWGAVVSEVRHVRAQGRPVLIGTGSVAESEHLGRRLTAAGITPQVLNARQDRAEAEIVAVAGNSGQVTVATNMAGRGTDIPLGAGVAELGGLHVIATCRNEAGRIDRQLFGRCARQGDPGSYQALLSLEDPLVQTHCPPLLLWLMQRRVFTFGPWVNTLRQYTYRHAQHRVERIHRRARRNLLVYERRRDRLLAFSGEQL